MIIYVHFCKLSPTIFAGSIPIACCLTMQHLCFGWSKIHQAPAFPSSMMLVMDSAQASGSPFGWQGWVVFILHLSSDDIHEPIRRVPETEGWWRFFGLSDCFKQKKLEKLVAKEQRKARLQDGPSLQQSIYVFAHAVCTEMFSREQLDKISRPLLWLKKKYACEHNMEATCNWQLPACCWVFSAHGGCPRPWKVPFPICNHLCNILSSHNKCENTEQISFGKGHSQNSKSGASSQSWTGKHSKKAYHKNHKHSQAIISRPTWTGLRAPGRKDFQHCGFPTARHIPASKLLSPEGHDPLLYGYCRLPTTGNLAGKVLMLRHLKTQISEVGQCPFAWA